MVRQFKRNSNERRSLQRRDAMMQAARALFIEHGYRKTTLEAIIAIAGGSRETIYKAFGGKQGLFGAIIAEVGSRLAESIDLEMSGLTLRDGLTRVGRTLVALWATDEVKAIHRVVLSEGIEAPEIMDAWYRGGPGPFLMAITEYFAAQRRAGAMVVDDPAIAARQFVLLLMGELAFPAMSGDAASFDGAAAVERTVLLTLRAYATPIGGETGAPRRTGLDTDGIEI